MKALPRWGVGVVGDKTPQATLELVLDRETVSRVELFKRQVQFGYETLQAGCIGGVWTASAHRRKGHAAAVIRQAEAMFVQWGYDVALLFSLEPLVPYYQRLGFERLTNLVSMRQPNAVATERYSDHVVVPKHVATLIKGMGAYVVLETDISLDIRGLPW